MRNDSLESTPAGVSVVIATLGGPTLKGTIEALNRGSAMPAEILICMPVPEVLREAGFAFPNVRVLRTACRGQVAQRAEGFRQAGSPFVMQLDDDIEVDHGCVERLLRTLQDFPDAAVAPSLIALDGGESVYRTDHANGVPRRIYHWLMNGREGYREGSILKSGTPIGVVPDGIAAGPKEVEWLAGGCVMHHRDNLVLENYFPFPGKAHCEDMIHSWLLVHKGVRLLIEPRASCSLEVSPPLLKSPAAFLRETFNDFLVRRYYMKLSGRGTGRMYLYYLLLLLRYAYLWLARRLTGRTGPSGDSAAGAKGASA